MCTCEVETKLFLIKAAELKTSFVIPTEAAADVTLRRLQKLRLAPGSVIAWTFGKESGEVKADASGRVTIPGRKVTAEPITLHIRTTKSARSDSALNAEAVRVSARATRARRGRPLPG